MKISRVEAITDGIVAIAATIMVLELKIPSSNDWAGVVELRNTILAYVSSFLIIYLSWALHHDLFKKAETLSRRSFIVNGIWILFLTFVPFSTAWAGTASDASVPVFLYALNLLLWSLTFQWLKYQVREDNPQIKVEKMIKQPYRLAMYIVLVLGIILAFIKPQFTLYLIGLVGLFGFILSFVKKGTSKDKLGAD